jgi:phage head maturation protease
VTIRRNLGGHVRAAKSEDGHHTVELRAITPNVVDDYGSVWMADTFDAALEQRLPVLAWSHDWSDPIGVGLDYQADPGGPLVTCVFDDFESVPRAKQAYSQTRTDIAGKPPTIRDCSVGFSQVKRREPTDEERKQWPGCVEVILEARMDELSLVLAGAVPGAAVVGVRSGQVRMAGAKDALISREAAGALIAKTATGELTLAEALNALNGLDTLEDAGTDEPEPLTDEQATALADLTDEQLEQLAGLEGLDADQLEQLTAEPEPAGAPVAAEVADLEADIEDALALIEA